MKAMSLERSHEHEEQNGPDSTIDPAVEAASRNRDKQIMAQWLYQYFQNQSKRPRKEKTHGADANLIDRQLAAIKGRKERVERER